MMEKLNEKTGEVVMIYYKIIGFDIKSPSGDGGVLFAQAEPFIPSFVCK